MSVSPTTHVPDFSVISLKQFHMPSVCLDRFGGGTIETPSSFVISDNFKFMASTAVAHVSLLEKNLSLKRGSRRVAMDNIVFF